jgi:GT2 family glycosyltransferase
MSEHFNISIVTFTNDISDIEKCLISLEKQNISMHIIVVDNLGSASVENFIKGWENVKYHRLANPGFGAAHNFATNQFIRTGYRIFLNPDIELKAGCLIELLQAFKSNNDLILASPKLLNNDETDQKFVRQYPSILNLIMRVIGVEKNKTLLSFKDVEKVNLINGAFFVLSNKLNNEELKFDERYFLYLEDLDFCIRLSSVGSIGVVHKALALHGHDRASRKNINLLLIHLRSFLYFWYKHGFFLKR